MVWSAADPTVQLIYKGRTEEGAMELFTRGFDLGKTTFHVVGMNLNGEVVLRSDFLECSSCTLPRT